jgi:hypothetical protein
MTFYGWVIGYAFRRELAFGIWFFVAASGICARRLHDFVLNACDPTG